MALSFVFHPNTFILWGIHPKNTFDKMHGCSPFSLWVPEPHSTRKQQPERKQKHSFKSWLIKLSHASPRNELAKDSGPPKTSLQLTFNYLTPCSDLVNCFNHWELIPFMPLLPHLRVVSGRCIVPVAPIHPEYQPSPTIFRSPGPFWYLSICLPPHSKLATLLSGHTL